MKPRSELLFILFLCSCIYDPPQKGKEILIHNETGKSIVILDSLTATYLKLYDTAIVNYRRYISRESNYMAGYGIYRKFYSDVELDNLKNKDSNGIILYIIATSDESPLKNEPTGVHPVLRDTPDLKNILNHVSSNRLFRSFVINIDTLKKYALNHLFITDSAILFEHYYHYTKRKQ